MLEASRGNNSIYLLCKDDRTISLRALSERILGEGELSLAVLLGCTEHLLPQEDPTATKELAHAAQLLSQRHASRPGDERVIWGLLANVKPPYDLETLWHSQDAVRTGFLMSSAQRVPAPTLNWAPRSPCSVEDNRHVIVDGVAQHYGVRYFSFDGSGSLEGRITPAGLRAKWLYWDVDVDAVAECCEKYVNVISYSKTQTHRVCREYRHRNVRFEEGQCIYDRPDMARACQKLEDMVNSGDRVRLLRPLADNGETAYESGANGGDRRGRIAALCQVVRGEDGGEKWLWDHVYEWCEPTRRPQWRIGELLLV